DDLGQRNCRLPVCLSLASKGSRCLYCVSTMANKRQDIETAAVSGDSPTLINAPKPKAPNKPPTLKTPWKDDMIWRPYRRCNRMACSFIAISIAPIDAPNKNSATPMAMGLFNNRSTGKIRDKDTPPNNITLLLPKRWINQPVMGIIIMAPAPKPSNNTPNPASFNPNRSLVKGTIGAQLERPRPHTKKINNTACLTLE